MPTRTTDLANVIPARKRPSLDFSLTGLIFCGIMMFMGLAAVNSQANLLFGVFGLMIGVLMVSVTVSRMVLRKLRVVRVLPENAVVGQRTVLSYECTNEKRYWPSLSLTVAELDGGEAFTRQPLAYMLHAAPGTTAIIGTELIPKRRGLHTFNRFQITTGFPFGFIKRAFERGNLETLLVYPAIGRVDHKLLRLCKGTDTGGAMLRPRRGGNDEFYGLKEYRTGENPRFIYWRRTARTGVLVSKEMTKVSPPRLLILVDTFRVDRSPLEDERIERGIAMAASLANEALEAGLMVGLFAWSDHWNGIAPNRGKRHSRDLLAALARLPRNALHNSMVLFDQARPLLKSGVTPVLITPREEGGPSSSANRDGMIVVPVDSEAGRAWFHFDPQVDFAQAVPSDQLARKESTRKTRGAVPQGAVSKGATQPNAVAAE